MEFDDFKKIKTHSAFMKLNVLDWTNVVIEEIKVKWIKLLLIKFDDFVIEWIQFFAWSKAAATQSINCFTLELEENWIQPSGLSDRLTENKKNAFKMCRSFIAAKVPDRQFKVYYDIFQQQIRF